MLEPAPRAPVEPAARPYHHGEGEDRESDLDPLRIERATPGQRRLEAQGDRHEQAPEQIHLLQRRIGIVRHQEHRAEHTHDRHGRRQREFPRERADLALARQSLPLEGILGRNRRRDPETRLLHGLLERLRGGGAGDIVHRDGLGRLVGGGADNARHAPQRLLQRRDARRVVQLLDGERHSGPAAVVARRAHGLDQLGDVRLRFVIVHGGFAGGVIDGGARDAAGLPERLLDGGGARGAAHPLDGQDDAGLTHGACAGRTTPAGRRRRARPRAGL